MREKNTMFLIKDVFNDKITDFEYYVGSEHEFMFDNKAGAQKMIKDEQLGEDMMVVEVDDSFGYLCIAAREAITCEGGVEAFYKSVKTYPDATADMMVEQVVIACDAGGWPGKSYVDYVQKYTGCISTAGENYSQTDTAGTPPDEPDDSVRYDHEVRTYAQHLDFLATTIERCQRREEERVEEEKTSARPN